MKILLTRAKSTIPSAAPPLGLLYIAACLRKNGEHELKIHDGRNLETGKEEMAQIIRDFKPDVIGINSFSMDQDESHELAALIKQINKDIFVIFGGPYPSSEPDNVVDDSNIDVAVVGEGEISSVKIIEALQNGGGFAEIPGIAYKENGKVVKTGQAVLVENLDDTPLPAWDLIDIDEYFTLKRKKRTAVNYHQWKKRVAQIFTSRGCPYKCVYCHNIFGKKVRYRSIDRVIDELKLLKEKYGIEEIEIIDDIFNVNLKRAKEIFRRIIAEKLDLKFAFPNGLRVELVDKEFLDLMKEAGVYRVIFAVETATPRLQKVLNKNVDIELARKNIEFAAQYGFSMGGFFMIGLPDETEEEMRKTIDFACESKLHTATFSIMTPFPGTETFDMAIKMGFKPQAEFYHYQKISFNYSKIPSERLVELRHHALRRFYLDPRRLYSYTKTNRWYNRFFEKLYVLIAATLFKYEG